MALALPGASRIVVCPQRLAVGAPKLAVVASRLVTSAPRCSQVHPKFFPELGDVLKLITITPMGFLYQSSEIAVTLKVGRIALPGSDNFLKLTHFSVHFTLSQTLLEASSD
jgi:hypothetical protein